MPKDLHASWRPPLRQLARIAFLHVLTAQKPNTLCHQTQLIEREIDSWVSESGMNIDTVYANREASIADEDLYDHPARDLWRMWIRTMVLCDVVIVHAHANGSSALGQFLGKAANAPHAPAVVILVPEHTPVSKAWRGEYEHHLNVKFVDIMGEGEDLVRRIMLAVHDILESRKRLLENGPARRAEWENAVADTANKLRQNWMLASRDVRVTVARKLQLSEEHMQDHIDDPMLLACLGFAKTLVALQMLVPSADLIIETGRKQLSLDTMTAWDIWRDDPNVEFEFAVWQLRRAIDAKQYSDAGVSQPLDLTNPGLWELFAESQDDAS